MSWDDLSNQEDPIDYLSRVIRELQQDEAKNRYKKHSPLGLYAYEFNDSYVVVLARTPQEAMELSTYPCRHVWDTGLAPMGKKLRMSLTFKTPEMGDFMLDFHCLPSEWVAALKDFGIVRPQILGLKKKGNL